MNRQIVYLRKYLNIIKKRKKHSTKITIIDKDGKKVSETETNNNVNEVTITKKTLHNCLRITQIF